MNRNRLIAFAAAGIAVSLYAAGCGSSGGSGSSAPGSVPMATPSPTPGPASTPTPTPAPTPATVSIPTINDGAAPMGFAFTSPETARSGDTVEWVNRSTAPHGITWDQQSPSSSPAPGANIPIFQPGSTSQSWVVPSVTQATTYHYHCTVHGPTMAGVITVSP